MNLTNNERSLLDKYAKLIAEYNKVMNLTGIDDYEGIYEKHYYDAYQVSKLIKELNVTTVADVGTGMGVPGIVLAILNPNLHIYLIEPMQKRCKFLNIVVEELKLNNVTIVNERSENLQIEVDLVVNRAVAKLNILLEICYNLIKDNGHLIALKAKSLNEELELSQRAIKTLGYEICDIQSYQLASDNSERNNIVMKRIGKKNKKFPREFKEIKRKPL